MKKSIREFNQRVLRKALDETPGNVDSVTADPDTPDVPETGEIRFQD